MNQQEMENALISLRQKVDDLEQQLAYHTGVTTGQNTINSPHPATDIDVATFAGGDMRIDREGIWMVSATSVDSPEVPRHVRWTQSLFQDVNAEVFGARNENLGDNYLIMRALKKQASAQMSLQIRNEDNDSDLISLSLSDPGDGSLANRFALSKGDRAVLTLFGSITSNDNSLKVGHGASGTGAFPIVFQVDGISPVLLPTASEQLRGGLVLTVGGSGIEDKLFVCRKNASDTYEWLELT